MRLVLFLLLIALPAKADAPHVGAPFWSEARAPGHARARALLDQALLKIELYRRSPDSPRAERHALLESALVRLERAHRLAPDDEDVTFQLAEALGDWEGGNERAAALLRGLRDRDPTYRAYSVAFQLGVLHTRAQAFEEAAREYEVALSASALERPADVATTYANYAEVTMLAGRLEDAVHAYDESERVLMGDGRMGSTTGFEPQHLALTRFGRAVALDRLGEHASALESAKAAMQSYPRIFDLLRSDGVFFEPPSEIHYYEGLAHLVMADDASLQAAMVDDTVELTPEQTRRARMAALRRARRSFDLYVRAVDPGPSWKDAGRAHVERIDVELARDAAQTPSRSMSPRR